MLGQAVTIVNLIPDFFVGLLSPAGLKPGQLINSAVTAASNHFPFHLSQIILSLDGIQYKKLKRN
jgi:hypothetical protein